MDKKVQGVPVPDDFDFDSARQDAVAGLMGPLASSHKSHYGNFAAAWNAVGYRFLSMAEHDAEYRRTFAGGLKTHEALFQLDRDLFDFFTNGLAVIECLCFGVYIVGSIVDPAGFPVTPDKVLKDVYPNFVRDKLQKYFPGDRLTRVVTDTVDSDTYREWRDIRNRIGHRISPPRAFHVSVGGPPQPTRIEWVVPGVCTLELTEDTTSRRRAWLSGATAALIQATEDFCRSRLPRPSAP